MVKVGKCALMHKKWTFRVELTKKTSHCKSRDFLRKRRLKTTRSFTKFQNVIYFWWFIFIADNKHLFSLYFEKSESNLEISVNFLTIIVMNIGRRILSIELVHISLFLIGSLRAGTRRV